MTTTMNGSETEREDVAATDVTDRVFTSVVHATETLTIALGDKLGYYGALRDNGPSTATELAAATGTVERYTREWLEQQATIGIVTVDDAGLPTAERRFSLSAGHAEALTDEVSGAYITPFATMVAAAAARLDDIALAHRNGGGVAWEAFGDPMRSGQGAANRPLFLGPLGGEWLPSIPEADHRLRNGGRVADVATGFGWSAIGMALAYPEIQVDGFDIDGPSIDAARTNAAQSGVADRVQFHHADGAAIAAEGSYDVVTMFEALHDLPFPVEVLATMRRLADEDGVVLVMDENVAERFGASDDLVERMMYGFSNLICLPDSMSHEGSAGTGTVMRHDVVRKYAREAGFSDATILPVDAGLFRFYRLQ